eukprot:8414449-Pyramimonas_sp.AAC.1
MAENYAEHPPRARAINLTAPYLVSQAKLASSLRADIGPDPLRDDSERRVPKRMPPPRLPLR